MYAVGTRVVSSIHGPATVLIYHKEMIGVHFDSSDYSDHSVDRWYDNNDGTYVAGHGIDVLTLSPRLNDDCRHPRLQDLDSDYREAEPESEMNKVKVVKVDHDMVIFDNGVFLYSEHESDCCESHYLDFSDLTLADFEGLEFDISSDDFFERIEDYGIALKPLNGYPVRIPGYGSNNGFYSSNLDLVLDGGKDFKRVYDIEACQYVIS